MRSASDTGFIVTAIACSFREMAVFETIRNFFTPLPTAEGDVVVPAAPTTYSVRPLTMNELDEVMRLNLRCFRNGENYTKHTFSFLLNEPETISYRAVTSEGDMAGFAFVMKNANGAAHLTTIGVAPEHRRRGVASILLERVETALRSKGIDTIVLEVRVGNTSAQELYRTCGYHTVQRISTYYNNGEDCFLMMKSLNV